MNITNEQFKALEKALMLLPSGKDYLALTEEEQDTISSADAVMIALAKKRKAVNARTAAYVANKRKTDKNYARSRKEN